MSASEDHPEEPLVSLPREVVPGDRAERIENEHAVQAFFRKLRERRAFNRALAKAAEEYEPPPD